MSGSPEPFARGKTSSISDPANKPKPQRTDRSPPPKSQTIPNQSKGPGTNITGLVQKIKKLEDQINKKMGSIEDKQNKQEE